MPRAPGSAPWPDSGSPSMWVERIEIGGFGRLRNLAIDLQDGLNVVTGLNEAGKSTLHQAIATALFGCFSTTDRRREQDAERRRERFAPWDGGAYRVSIVTRNAQGVALRIDWDLSGRTLVRRTRRHHGPGSDRCDPWRRRRRAARRHARDLTCGLRAQPGRAPGRARGHRGRGGCGCSCARVGAREQRAERVGEPGRRAAGLAA